MRQSRWVFGSLLSGFVVLAALSCSAAEDAGEVAPAPARKFTRVPAPDGIQIRRYNQTDGAQPRPTDRVRVHYHGTFDDGTVFDSSVERGTPATFPLNRVIPCWTKAVTLLHVGEKAEVICPPDQAYGKQGAPGRIPPNARLTFEIELLEVL
ncbi:MAG: FKBP-type peptidyl-prolyl cis-trans isomerase [Myxococcota bacterium]